MPGRPCLPPLAAAAILVMAAGGCGSSGSSASTSGLPPITNGLVSVSRSTRTSASRSGYRNAAAERDRLLRLAVPGGKVRPDGTIPGWPAANGSAIPATPTQVSGFGFLVDRANNSQYLDFAVRDTAGRCAGGDILGNATGTEVVSAQPVTVPPKAPCTGDEVAKIAGHR